MKKKVMHICRNWRHGSDKLQPCEFLQRDLEFGKVFYYHCALAHSNPKALR